MKFKEVSKKEYLEFLYNYPNKFEVNVAYMCDPPMETHNDFSSGQGWPESVIAKRKLNERYRPEDGHDRYWILDSSEKELEIRKAIIKIIKICSIDGSEVTIIRIIEPIIKELLK
jgi:hypothetical protein